MLSSLKSNKIEKLKSSTGFRTILQRECLKFFDTETMDWSMGDRIKQCVFYKSTCLMLLFAFLCSGKLNTIASYT